MTYALEILRTELAKAKHDHERSRRFAGQHSARWLEIRARRVTDLQDALNVLEANIIDVKPLEIGVQTSK